MSPRSFSRPGAAPRREPSAGVPAGARLLLRAREFFASGVWAEARVRERGARGAAWRGCRVAYLSARGFTEDRCLFRASALTYITVLSLVPLLAFSFSIAKGLGFYQDLLQNTVNPFLDRSFGPLVLEGPVLVPEGAHEMRVAIARVLDLVGGVIENTRVTGLAAFGLLFLAWTVIKLLSTIERSFNDIWGAPRSRPLLRKVSDYLAMVIVTPIFLVVAAGVTTAAQDSGLVAFLRGELHLGFLLDLVVAFTPLLSLWVGFTFVYLAMPNARTRLSSALIGALVGGTLWQLFLLLHLKFQIGIARTSAIYAGFAAIPIFLVWVNLAWVAVLIGAEVCFAHQSEPAWTRMLRGGPADHAFKEVVALRAMARIGERFLAGGAAWTADALAAELGAPPRILDEVLGILTARGILLAAPAGKVEAFSPARDLDAISVKSVVDALKGTAGPAEVPSRADVDERIERALAGIDRDFAGSRHNLTLRQLAEAVAREDGEGAGSAGRAAG